MEVRGGLVDVNHPHVLWQARVEAARYGVDGMRGRHADAGDLAERMDAGIGPAGAVHRDRHPFKARERVFYQPLDGYALRLPLPADETRSVVTDCELERTGQSAPSVPRQVRDPGFTTGCLVRHNGHDSSSYMGSDTSASA